MNILYIDHYAGSISMGMEFRPYYFAKEWQKMGHKVRIVGATYSHLRKVNPTVINDFEIQQIDGADFQFIKTREYSGNGISRAITMIQFCAKLWLKAKKISCEFRPDIIIASSTYPLDTFPANRIKKFSGGKLIHEIHDMWPAVLVESYGMSPKNPFVMAMQLGEDTFCRNSDKVVSILPCAEEYLLGRGLKKGKFEYISNGVVEEDWINPAPLPGEYQRIIDNIKRQGKLVLGFFGSLTPLYNIHIMIEAISKLQEKNVFFLIVGDGIYKDELINLAKELNLDETIVRFMPPIRKVEIPSLIKQLDASYVAAVKDEVFRFGIGMNKLFDSMMGGVPILYAVDAPNNMVLDYDCGINVEAENVDALVCGIGKLVSMSNSDRKILGSNGHRAIIENFTYRILAEEFIKVMSSLEVDLDEDLSYYNGSC